MEFSDSLLPIIGNQNFCLPTLYGGDTLQFFSLDLHCRVTLFTSLAPASQSKSTFSRRIISNPSVPTSPSPTTRLSPSTQRQCQPLMTFTAPPTSGDTSARPLRRGPTGRTSTPRYTPIMPCVATIQGGEAEILISYYREQGVRKFHSLSLPTDYLRGGPIGRPYREHCRAPYSKLGSSPNNLSEPCIQICINRKLFMFTFIYQYILVI